MHEYAHTDARIAIEEVHAMVDILQDSYPMEERFYRRCLVSDDLWDKNERRIKRAIESFLLEQQDLEGSSGDELFDKVEEIRRITTELQE